MQNFTYYNPVKLVFGKGAIAQLAQLVPADAKVLMAYGGGSIMKNGVYEQVVKALAGREVVEFGGIEPNPRYETLMKAVEIVRAEEIDFLLAVGGGSVLDGVKFIAAAAPFEAGDPWKILSESAPFSKAIALGSVLTLPATGSEMNANSVVSRDSTSEKFAFSNPLVFPTFSILDPETTYSLPPRQVANGIIDAFAHTMEQYMTYPASAMIQDRWAESILSTLIELGPEVLASNDDYDSRANFMWTATVALNGIIGVGVPQDWATHGIGHEITALYGLDHAQTLAVVMPALFRARKDQKRSKLLQYAARVWGITEGNEEERIEAAIAKTEGFFRSLQVKTRLAEYGVTEGIERIPARFADRGTKLGERGDIDSTVVAKILELCAK